ncbi:hypothetical protein [Lacrimispora amygdalina]|uniref:hypothetical protein n=1 Tax=Lacrimispora amygdalina TaxID=253257 RepID=UPI000BE277DB|nr:hypothetical protein [Lacrimispora amygdalina]
MSKKYFGSFSLQNTIHYVKKAFPECKVSFNEDDNQKSVSIKFDPENRKRYKLSEGFRTYLFLNEHLILSNGAIDPFKYDALDALIENTELQYDVDKQRESVNKIRTALDGCMRFFEDAIINFGNKNGKEYDIKFVLNDVERAYHLNLGSESVHMEKLNPEIILNGEQEYKLSKLNPKIIYKILKTTHPGLRTSATEFISGLRDDKTNWKSVEDAYIKPWKKETYEAFGISPFDVLADVTESRLVGEFVNGPMRRLVLIDGSQYAYRDTPLEVIPYTEYKERRDMILKKYKEGIMNVCKNTGVITPRAIEIMNIYTGKIPGPVILKEPNEAIREIRIARLENPLAEIISKINRAIKLHNHIIGFTALIRKPYVVEEIKKIDINENGTITKIEINMIDLSVSKPYVMTSGRKKIEVNNLKKLKLTGLFIDALKEEIIKMLDKPEYKLYLFIHEINKIGLKEGKIICDDDSIFKLFEIGKLIIYFDPYKNEISVSNAEIIKSDPEIYKKYKKVIEIYERFFHE